MNCLLQGVAGLVCRKKLPERHNGDGTEAATVDSGAAALSVQSVQASSSDPDVDSQPSVSLADSSSTVDSSRASLSIRADQSGRQQIDAVTERLAGLELRGGLRQRRRNGHHQDAEVTVIGSDRHQRADDADEPDAQRN